MPGKSGAIRAGRAYVEAFLDQKPLVRGLKLAQARLKAFGASVQAMGLKLLGVGMTMGAPFAAGLKTFADFEQAMAELRNAANPTADQLARIDAAVMAISKSTGAGPAEVAASMTELLKAGMDVEAVLGGATTAALEFAKVGKMDVAAAATVLNDALNVFSKDGLTAARAADIISKAADASSIEVEQVAQSFSQAGAVAALARQNMRDLANAIAILGFNGVKGSDAGTALKTMLAQLMAPTSEGAKVIKEYGLEVRDSSGRMKDMRGIVVELENKLGGLSDASRDAALRNLFGSDAIRPSAILLKAGAKGWDEFSAKIDESLTVSEKYAELSKTLHAWLKKLRSAAQRLAIALNENLGGGIQKAFAVVLGVIDGLTQWAKANPEIVRGVALAAAAVAGLGAALLGLSLGVTLVSFAFGGLATVASLVVGLIGAAVVGLGGYFAYTSGLGGKALAGLGQAFGTLQSDALAAWGGIISAVKAGDLQAAGKVAMAFLNLEFERLKGKAIEVWRAISFGLTKALLTAFAYVEATWIALVDNVKRAIKETKEALGIHENVVKRAGRFEFGPNGEPRIVDKPEPVKTVEERMGGVFENLGKELETLGELKAGADGAAAASQELKDAMEELRKAVEDAEQAERDSPVRAPDVPPDAAVPDPVPGLRDQIRGAAAATQRKQQDLAAADLRSAEGLNVIARAARGARVPDYQRQAAKVVRRLDQIEGHLKNHPLFTNVN